MKMHAAEDTLLEETFLAANPEINVFHITLAIKNKKNTNP